MLAGSTFHHLYSYPRTGSVPAGQGWHATNATQSMFNIFWLFVWNDVHAFEIIIIRMSFIDVSMVSHLWPHRSKSRVDRENRWQCRCYRNQDYRVDKAHADQKVAVLLRQQQLPNKSEALPTYIWPESERDSINVLVCFKWKNFFLDNYFTLSSLSQVLYVWM